MYFIILLLTFYLNNFTFGLIKKPLIKDGLYLIKSYNGNGTPFILSYSDTIVTNSGPKIILKSSANIILPLAIHFINDWNEFYIRAIINNNNYYLCVLIDEIAQFSLNSKCFMFQKFRLEPTFKSDKTMYILFANGILNDKYLTISKNNDLKATSKAKTKWKFENRNNQYHVDNQTEPPNTYELYNIDKKLGAGNFGIVYLATSKLTNKQYALKEIPIFNNDEKNIPLTIQKEIDTLTNIEHELVIKLHTTFVHNWDTTKQIFGEKFKIYKTYTKSVFLVFDYIPGKSLGTVINDFKINLKKMYASPGKFGFLSEKTVKFYAACIFMILDNIHNKHKIAHRDIKPDNFMINENGYLVLIDFGLTTKIENEGKYSTVGTFIYTAPEVLALTSAIHSGKTQIPYSFPVDMWSTGILLHLLLTGKIPVTDKYVMDAGAGKINENNLHNYIILDKILLNTKAGDVLSNLLVVDPNKRFKNLHEISMHPWFHNFKWDLFSQGNTIVKKPVPKKSMVGKIISLFN